MLARSVFQAEVSYRQMLVVKAYAMLVVAVEWAVRAVLVLAMGDIGAHLGLGASFCPRRPQPRLAAGSLRPSTPLIFGKLGSWASD